MNKIAKRLIATLFSIIVSIVSIPNGEFVDVCFREMFSFTASAVSITSYKQGDIIEFGWYPQSKVTDNNIISVLNSVNGEWKSYNYYSGTGDNTDGQMKPGDYMRYKDVVYGSNKYRGVVFDTYRPHFTGYETTISGSYTHQDDNGYKNGNVYWFKYEPIKWRVIDPKTGMVIAESLLDSQAFSNYYFFDGSSCYGDGNYYPNDYSGSSIRKWLNENFYITAFSKEQQNMIQQSTFKYSFYISNSNIISQNISDKVYLLSIDDVLNEEYGFNSTYDYVDSRIAQGTDYAKCQGLVGPWWWLRSPGNTTSTTTNVGVGGLVDNEGDVVECCCYGVRPVLNFDMNSAIYQSDVKDVGENVLVASEANYIIETYLMKCNGEYEKLSHSFNGIIGEFVSPEYTIPNGFFLNVEKSILEGKITADNSLVLKVYLDRNTYTLTTVVDGVSTETKYLYGSIVSEPVKPSKAGYKFVNWDKTIPKTMPDENVIIMAVFEKCYLCPDCSEEILGESAINEHIATETRMKAVVEIKNNSGTKTINYGETLKLFANVTNMPSDVKIYWYVDDVKKGEGETFNVNFESGTKIIEVKLVDVNGNILKDASGNELSDSESVTVKSGFFQKIISFFKNIFGINRTVVQSIFKEVF